MVPVKEKIKNFAQEIGLPIFGITSPEPLKYLESFIARRKSIGLESPFEKKWSVERRCYPERCFSEAKSIICVGMPYQDDGEWQAPGELRKCLSRFVWGKDYHIVMKGKLEQLAGFIKNLAGENFKYISCVDSTPLVERALAYRAGIGWYGKNCLLYTPEYGSLFFLGELVTNLSIETDRLMTGKQCASCDLCIRSCPTGAIIEPFNLDAKKCISYLTQSSGFIPLELRPKIGAHVYGCDICQAVCPWNKINFGDRGQLGGEGVAMQSLLELLYISESQFMEKYSASAMGWAGREVIRRNAAVALGNIGQGDLVSELEPALHDPEPLIRAHTAWALGKIGGMQAKNMLLEALGREKNPTVREEIRRAEVYC